MSGKLKKVMFIRQYLVLLRQNLTEQPKTKTKYKHCKQDHILISCLKLLYKEEGFSEDKAYSAIRAFEVEQMT